MAFLNWLLQAIHFIMQEQEFAELTPLLWGHKGAHDRLTLTGCLTINSAILGRDLISWAPAKIFARESFHKCAC